MLKKKTSDRIWIGADSGGHTDQTDGPIGGSTSTFT